MRRAAPPVVRKVPDKTKNGIAIIEKLSSPVNSFCEMMEMLSIDSEETVARNTSTVIPKAMEMGVPVNSNNNSTPKIT